MRDELDQRVRDLTAERLRPVPPPPIVCTADEPLAVRIGRLHLLEELASGEEHQEAEH